MARSAYQFRVPRLDSIRSRILALAVLGTFIPTALSLGIAYTQNRRALEAQITQNLLSASSQAAHAAGVWLKEQLYDLRIFASSEEVKANVNRYAIGQGSIPSANLREYLRSLQEKYRNFEQLLVMDSQGRIIASSAQRASAVQLPTDWQKTMRQSNQLVGDSRWDEKAGKGSLLVAVPITRADGQIIGAFAAEIALVPIQSVLKDFASDRTAVSLVSESGALVAVSGAINAAQLANRPSPETLQRLREREHAAVAYRTAGGLDVIGTLDHVPQQSWSVVAELPSEEALSEVRRFRNVALLVVVLLLAVVSWTAFRLGLVIVRPLERLAAGANVVSTGDLEVDLPTTGEAGEVDDLTHVFNNMVRRLRVGRQQLSSLTDTLRTKAEALEQLSVTDGLTGLVNHRALMQRLGEEVIRSQRNERPFCVIMTDVDYFKKYNDEFGHPAGDEVLKQVALILKEATRTVDCVARYGGEEFAALLPETGIAGAMEVAERMRARVASHPFANREVTVSVGVSEFPMDADTGARVISVADKALYEAKRNGRNQVVRAKSTGRKTRATMAMIARMSRAMPAVKFDTPVPASTPAKPKPAAKPKAKKKR